jgi:hypothetical protein
MTPAEAAKLLELPDNATPDQIEARFHELRTKLEEKIGKAPTPGLKAKYRESLDEITVAFETLTLAADSTALPVLRREQGEGRKEQGRGAEAGGSGPAPATRRKSGSEFIVVVVIAMLVLGAGGWWVMKTRAEKAEQARIAAEAKAEADRKAAAEKAEAERKAAEEKRLAEEKRQAEEAEKARLVAATKAEAERVEKLTAQVRVQIAEARLAWEQLEREERIAERDLADLRQEERSGSGKRGLVAAKAEAQARYARWLTDFLGQHPYRRAEVRASELLSARQVDDAATAAAALGEMIEDARSQVSARRPREEQLYGTLRVEPGAADIAWTLTDAFGEKHTGFGATTVSRVAAGTAEIAFRRSGWPDQAQRIMVRAGQSESITATFRTAELVLTSEPAGAEVRLGGKSVGRTPLKADVIPGVQSFAIRLPGYKGATLEVTLAAGETVTRAVTLELEPVLTDAEIAAFARALPTTNVVRAIPQVEWQAQRVEVPGASDRVGVCFFTFRPVAMSLTAAPPPASAGWFAESPLQMPVELNLAPERLLAEVNSSAGRGAKIGTDITARLGTQRRVAQARQMMATTETAWPRVAGTYVLLTGLLERRDLAWYGNNPRVETSSNPAFAATMADWIRRSSAFRLTGEPASISPLVYVLVKHRGLDSR